jgi:hypothetical protein
MACPTCGNSILFGGIKNGERKYCSKKCYEADEVNRFAVTIPDQVVEDLSYDIHDGKCPKCNGDGPIDVHKSYSVYSITLYTKWTTHEHIICKKCASKKQTTNLVSSLLLGWWGFPFGLIVTPIIALMNIIAMFQNRSTREPSKVLKKHSRSILASQHFENSN